MHRTQIYITDQQQCRIADRAKDARVPKAEVIRQLLDQGLGIDDGADQRRRAIAATAGVLEDAEDWQAWLARVRGTGADDRLKQLER
jgi:hypothetical protein